MDHRAGGARGHLWEERGGPSLNFIPEVLPTSQRTITSAPFAGPPLFALVEDRPRRAVEPDGLNLGQGVRSAPWSFEMVSRAFDFHSDDAVIHVIVDEPHGLHKGVDRGRPDEFPTLLFKLLRQGH